MIRISSFLLLCAFGVAGSCTIFLEEPQPIVVMKFGSKSAIIRKKMSEIQLPSNDSVTLHCATGFTLWQYGILNERELLGGAPFMHESTFELTCYGGHIFINEFKVQDLSNSELYVSCTRNSRDILYESNISLPGCNHGSMTLIIGSKLYDNKDSKLLGMCYDPKISRLRFVSYVAYAPITDFLENNWGNDLQTLQLDSRISGFGDYFNSMSVDELEYVMAHQQLGALFQPDLFEYASMLQDEPIVNQVSNYEPVLNVLWLRALLKGNWQHFLNALRKGTNDQNGIKYNVRVGVSGIASLPPANNCSDSQTLILNRSNGGSLTVPALIWAHLRALETLGGEAEEFVILAHNSPYANVLEMSALCPDMCAAIPWLRNTLFGQLHLVPNYGVVLCCRMDQLGPKLFDFPYELQTQAQPPPMLPPLPHGNTIDRMTPIYKPNVKESE